MKHTILLILCLLTAGVATAQETITSGGKQRSMIVYAPKNLPANRPLLISMHGMNQDANYQRSQANYEAVADTAKFVVVYPNGEGNGWDLSGTKDINFILDIIEAMVKRYNINRNRVYLSGFSMGGMMTYFAMTKIADKIAAFAPVSGYNMGGPNATSSRPIPIIHVHGTGDDVCTYSPVQSHIDAWVKRNQCKTTPITVKKGTSGEGTLYRYTGGLNGVEVAHLKLPGKGHWHSNDPVYGMSNIEIWNFCNRFALGPDAPTVKSVEPEDLSFDLTPEHRTFTVKLSKNADVSKASAQLKAGSKTIKLKLAETENSKTLTFTIPEGTATPNGECTFTASGITAVGGDNGNSVSTSYIYGITEVSDVLTVDTLLRADWPSMQDEVGQGIPLGWRLYMYDSDGNATQTNSGTANLTSGCRLFYLPTGGDFTTGFYLSARDKDKALLSYGRLSSHRLNLPKGKYDLTFRSTYWSTGSKDGNASFGACLHTLTGTTNIFEDASISPKGCQEENAQKKATGTALHQYTLNITSKANYSLDFYMTQGWSSILLADVMITTQLSIPEQYKGTFHRLMLQAEAICDSSEPDAVPTLRAAVDKYRDFASTSPTAYTAAIKAMQQALKSVPTGIAETCAAKAAGTPIYYSIDGRRLDAPRRGVVIERSGNSVRKLIVKQ